MHLFGKNLVISTKCQADLCPFIQGHSFGLPHTYLETSVSQKSLGCLMDYSLDCLSHLTKMSATPIYGKTQFVPL